MDFSICDHTVGFPKYSHILQCMDQRIDWDLVVQLYKRNAGSITSIPGLMLIPKIKYEHVYLTNFSKMRVDLAAQVNTRMFLPLCILNIVYRY